jgi:glutamate N-acetyltransferase/amino-acid N-acetyltransferase
MFHIVKDSVGGDRGDPQERVNLRQENGKLIDPALEKEACAIMKKPEFEVTIDLKNGHVEFTCYTCDLTKEYIAINADCRT